VSSTPYSLHSLHSLHPAAGTVTTVTRYSVICSVCLCAASAVVTNRLSAPLSYSPTLLLLLSDSLTLHSLTLTPLSNSLTPHSLSLLVSVAWTVQRIISAFHSAMRGGLMCARNFMLYLSEMKVLKIDPEVTMLDELAGYGLAALGLYFQLSYGFSLPFPLNVLLFPFTVMEYLLIAMISK
jgi:hypothetical protein